MPSTTTTGDPAAIAHELGPRTIEGERHACCRADRCRIFAAAPHRFRL